MKRRTFLKLTGMTAASTMLTGCHKGNEKLIPFLISPEDSAVPGLANFYASTCRQCPAGCGIIVKVSEGRAKKIEGNPLHPVNLGKLCSRGQSALQELYHPDRIRQPLKRVGRRGAGEYTPISWEEALSILGARMLELQDSGETDRLACITSPLNGSLALLLNRFMQSFGSSHHLAWELLNTEWLKQSVQAVFGQSSIPDYDIENTQYLLSFGADFIESHLSPVRYGNSFGAMRQVRPTIRGRFTYVGARMSLTAASADLWMPARPGTEGILALGFARELIAVGNYNRKGLFAAGIKEPDLIKLLQNYSLEKVAEATGLGIEMIRTAAKEVLAIRPALALAGESVAWQTNGLESTKAILLLNILLGNVGQPGGIYLPSDSPTHFQSNHEDLIEFINKAQNGQFRLAMIYRSNPYHNLPPSLGLQDALAQVPFLVSFNNFFDDTTRMADLILPDHSDLESWGDIIPDRGTRKPVIGMMQPVVKPLHNTRSFADVMIAISQNLGPSVADAIPWESSTQLLQETYLEQNNPIQEGQSQAWNHLLQQGGDFGKPAEVKPIKTGKTQLPKLTDAVFAGDVASYPFHLQLYPSPNFSDGRNANLPWLQQLPDPMTTAVWDSWVEINPSTARKLGISHGDLVEVVSPQGRLELPAVIYPALHPDVLAIPIGQGHEGFGRYADKVGVNPLQLLSATEDTENRLPAWGATRAQVYPVSSNGNLVTAGHPAGSYRRDILGF